MTGNGGQSPSQSKPGKPSGQIKTTPTISRDPRQLLHVPAAKECGTHERKGAQAFRYAYITFPFLEKCYQSKGSDGMVSKAAELLSHGIKVSSVLGSTALCRI